MLRALGPIAAFAVLAPSLVALIGLIVAGGGFDFAALAHPHVQRVIVFSALQAFLSTLISLVMGAALALALARRTHFIGRSWFMAALATATVLPSLVVVFVIVAIYGRSGFLAQMASAIGHCLLQEFRDTGRRRVNLRVVKRHLRALGAEPRGQLVQSFRSVAGFARLQRSEDGIDVRQKRDRGRLAVQWLRDSALVVQIKSEPRRGDNQDPEHPKPHGVVTGLDPAQRLAEARSRIEGRSSPAAGCRSRPGVSAGSAATAAAHSLPGRDRLPRLLLVLVVENHASPVR